MNNKYDYPLYLEKYSENMNVYLYPYNGEIVLNNEMPSPKQKIDFSEAYEHNKIEYKRLTFRLTGKCNMSCPYCFNKFNKLEGKLKSEYYVTAIDNFIEQLSKGDYAGIIITGGEPTLYKKDIYNIFEYANKKSVEKGVKVKYLLYSNFTLADDEFLSFISKYNCSIAISIDGIQEKHDNNRVNPTNTSSYKQILHNLLVAIEKYDIQLEARTVVQENECDLLEIINNNLSLGFNRMHLMPVYGFESFQYSGNVDIWRKAIEVYERLIINGYRIEIEPFYSLYRKIRFPHTFYTSFYPCNAGRKNICMGDDGKYYLCNHFVGNESCNLGNYMEGLPKEDDVWKMIDKLSNNEVCNNCYMFRLCGGTCYHKVALNKAPNTIDDCENWIEIIKMTILSYIKLYNNYPTQLSMLCDSNKGEKVLDRKFILENIKKQIDEMNIRGIK